MLRLCLVEVTISGNRSFLCCKINEASWCYQSCLVLHKEFQMKAVFCGFETLTDLGNLLTQVFEICRLYVATDYFCIVCLSSYLF